MLINAATLDALFIGFKTSFNIAFDGAPSFYKRLAMVVPSMHREEHYGFLGQIPTVREWIGDRIVKNLSAHKYAIENRRFESTVSVERTNVEDDAIGMLGPAFGELGRAAAELPDRLCFELLKNGFTELCYDGQAFFDTDHPVGTNGGEFPVTSVSNMQAGAGPAWFLLDTTRMIKPIVYQERIPYRLTALNRDEDKNVFFEDTFIYGTRGRSNAGYGLWQLAFASQAPLDATNYEAARTAMASLKGDEGRPLGVKPNVLVVPPSLEGAAMRLLNNGTRIVDSGGTPVAVQNEWANTAEPLITSWLV